MRDLLEEAGIDVPVVSSKHNIQYLLGGYRFFFFDHFDAIGLSRYLPLLVYPRGGRRTPPVSAIRRRATRRLSASSGRRSSRRSGGLVGAMRAAAGHLGRLGKGGARIGVERAFLPADAEEALRGALPNARIVEAVPPLERLRAVKTPAELDLLREASIRARWRPARQTTLTSMSPTPSMCPVITSPRLTAPTPEGVPEKMRSPGARAKSPER